MPNPVDKLSDLLHFAWGVIANVDEGAWNQNEMWRQAASDFQKKYVELMRSYRSFPNSGELTVENIHKEQ